MPQERLAPKILAILQEHKALTLDGVQKKLKNDSEYVYTVLRQLVSTKQIYCVNSEIYVYGNPDELLDMKYETGPSVSMPGWYDPTIQYVPVTRTWLVSYLIDNKPPLQNFDIDNIMMMHAAYVWYCLAHPRLDTSYLTPKEGYDKDEAASQFNTLKDSLHGQ